MTDTIFNLQVRLVADDDRGEKQNRKLIEELLAKALKQVLPECIVLRVSSQKKD
jgi:hypothetical protein